LLTNSSAGKGYLIDIFTDLVRGHPNTGIYDLEGFLLFVESDLDLHVLGFEFRIGIFAFVDGIDCV